VRARSSLLSCSLLVLCLACSCLALDPSKTLTQDAHRIWGQEEGLFQPTIYSILQTRDGFLWLGTQDSLIRFDGMRFREFDESSNAAFHRALVRSLLEDKQGRLWAASVGNGLAEISSGEVLKRFTAKDGLPSDDVFCLNEGRGGEMWACTNKGLARWDGRSFHIFTTASGLPSNLIRDTCLAPDGTRWVAGFDFGLARSIGERYQPYSDSLISPRETVTALHCNSDGSLWIGTSVGLAHLAGKASHKVTTQDGLPDDAVSALAEGRDGSLWIGTNSGVSRYRHGEISSYTTRDGLSHSVVLSLYEDWEGTLWAGTKNGLDQFTDSKVTPYTTTEGLSGNDTGPVLEDKEGRLWIGTLGHGLNSFDGHRFTSLTERDGLLDNRILSLEVDAAGDLWAGTAKGLNRLRHGHVIGTYTRRSGLSGPQVRALFSDFSGTLWAGTDKGLDRLDGTRFISSPILSGKDNVGILALAGGRTASLFVSTEDSRFFTVRNGTTTAYPTDTIRSVDCYLVDKTIHETWMGTLGSGLLRWRNGIFTHVRVRDGIYDNRIYGIVKDDHANLWLASSKGIFRVSQKELDDFADGKIPYVTSIPFSTGQLRFECQSGVQPAAARTRDGRLWFSTTNGLVMVDPNHLRSNGVPPPVRINAVIVNGQRVLAGSTELSLKPSERNIEIRYAGLSFLSPEKVSFQYKLEGFDKAWTDAGSRREAFFTNLPPGGFQFKVRARNADGVWSAQDASFPFKVEPRFYQRVWFFPALAVVFGLLAAAVYRARVYRLRKTFNLVLSERSRIARELHDTLLQGLSGVTMQLQALWTRLPASREKVMLAEIIGDAGKASQEARRSLWGLRMFGSDSLIFSDRLAKLAREAVAEQPVSLMLHLQPASLCAWPEIEYQLLRIVTEVLANTNAHAQAKTIEIRLAVVGQELRLTITDDGIGFTPGLQQPFGHFGLIGIRERADEIEAELTINSAPGSGTTVAINVTLRELQGSTESNAVFSITHHKE
jgi:ligand-binding sensor domain-containing protein/signal transduction histidine kinase